MCLRYYLKAVFLKRHRLPICRSWSLEKTGAESCHVHPGGNSMSLSTTQFPQGGEKNDTDITEMQEGTNERISQGGHK